MAGLLTTAVGIELDRLWRCTVTIVDDLYADELSMFAEVFPFNVCSFVTSLMGQSLRRRAWILALPRLATLLAPLGLGELDRCKGAFGSRRPVCANAVIDHPLRHRF